MCFILSARGCKMIEDGRICHLDFVYMASDWPKLASRCLQVGPSWLSVGLKIVPYGPYFLLMDRIFAPRSLKVSYLKPKMLLWLLQGGLRWPRVAQVGSTKDPWWLRKALRWPQIDQHCPLVAWGRAKHTKNAVNKTSQIVYGIFQ